MPKLGKHPKRLAGGLYRRLPWYGKLLVPIVVLTLGLYLLEELVSLFG
ncbi:hypothetical protein EDF24_0707 [Curtobacterium sp. PhB130]|nr:hypothetical protein [Curtobacterium sp. PhB130]ROS77938.1 hypothetical protein EDF24_0707 [Curtobacterium sp. PhB130]